MNAQRLSESMARIDSSNIYTYRSGKFGGKSQIALSSGDA